MIKKLMLLAAAVAALAAFAVPASASAAMFYNNGPGGHEEIGSGGIHETATGTIAFEGPAGGITCEAHPTITWTTNGLDVNSLGVTLNTCVGTKAFAGCEVTYAELENSGSEVTATDFDITEVEIFNEFSNCFTSELTLNFASITASPDNAGGISTVELSGSGSATVPGIGTLPASASGELEVANAGTIAIT